jgi:hypothetical protein
MVLLLAFLVSYLLNLLLYRVSQGGACRSRILASFTLSSILRLQEKSASVGMMKCVRLSPASSSLDALSFLLLQMPVGTNAVPPVLCLGTWGSSMHHHPGNLSTLTAIQFTARHLKGTHARDFIVRFSQFFGIIQ